MTNTMHTYISMLRGINVSGQIPIKMPMLKALYESLGFPGVTTYIQSGNVIFRSPQNEPSSLVKAIETAMKKTFGFEVTVVIRRSDDLARIINACPFVGRDGIDSGKLHVTFLNEPPATRLVKRLEAQIIKTADEFVVSGCEVFVHCPNGYGKTRLSNTFFEKHLEVAATTRNWKSVNTLYAMTMEVPSSLL
jgi:uncharacterized protein (DUF1697 family)